MASIREIKGRFYGAWTDDHGKRIERRLVATTRREAVREASKREERAFRIRRGLEDADVEMTVAELYEKYEPVARRQSGFKALESRYRVHIGPHFGHWALREVRPADIDRFLSKKLEGGLAPATVERLRMALAALFTHAIKRERVFRGDNPARIATPIDVPQRPARFLPPGYMHRIIDAVAPQWRNLFAVALYTGLRSGELKALRLVDVDLASRALLVHRSNKRETTKGKRLRVVPIPAEAIPFVEAAVAVAKGGLLFSTKKGKQLSVDVKLADRLRTALVKVGLVEAYEARCVNRGRLRSCGFKAEQKEPWPGDEYLCPRCKRMSLYVKARPIPLTFHNLRTTYGTYAYEATGDIRFVQRVLGHADVSTTERVYTGVRLQRLLEQADKVQFRSAALPQSKPNEADSGEAKQSETKPNHRGDNGIQRDQPDTWH